jgi:lysophospholipase L1-like esterase
MRDEVVVLGDSVTQGAGFSGVTESTCYVSLLRNELADAGVSVRLRPSAIDGVDTAYALKRFDRMVGRLQPDVLILALGLNDAQPLGRRSECNPDCYARNLAQLTERALEIHARPIIATPSPRLDVHSSDQPPSRAMQPYAERARMVAEHYQLPLIEVYEHFVSRGDLDELIPDRLHPGPDGHRLIADQFARTLLPLFGAGKLSKGRVVREAAQMTESFRPETLRAM